MPTDELGPINIKSVEPNPITLDPCPACAALRAEVKRLIVEAEKYDTWAKRLHQELGQVEADRDRFKGTCDILADEAVKTEERYKPVVEALRAEVERLREAVEWAIDRLSQATVMSISTYYIDAVIETLDELHRRAGK